MPTIHYDMTAWISYLSHESEIRLSSVFTLLLVYSGFIALAYPLISGVREADRLRIVIVLVAGLVAVSLYIFFKVVRGEDARRRKLADGILNDILVQGKYKTIGQVRDAWISGLEEIQKNSLKRKVKRKDTIDYQALVK